MCLAGQPPAPPATAAEAMAMAQAALGWLAGADAASLTSAEQADTLRALERAQSLHTAARARVLRAFDAQGGYEDDGHGSARNWLKWQTGITGGAAAAALAWVRRLPAPPAVADARAAAQISGAGGRQICGGTGPPPPGHRGAAGQILPARGAGQPPQIQLHLGRDQRGGQPGAADAEDAWAGPAAAPGADCDATIVPIVTGHVDPDVLDQLAAALLRGRDGHAEDDEAAATAEQRRQCDERAMRQILIARAADLMSGPAGLAAYLRTGLLRGPAPSA